jgi:hypothetical protein
MQSFKKVKNRSTYRHGTAPKRKDRQQKVDLAEEVRTQWKLGPWSVAAKFLYASPA